VTPPPRLDVRALRAGYRRIEVVHGIDLQVNAGEIVALFGPNGAGKTTTLLTIMGMLPPIGGTVCWDGNERHLAPHKRAQTGVAPVIGRSVLQQLSTLANLRLGRGHPERALQLFPELRPLLRRRAGLLSGGEQQMLTMARALAANPSVLLLDEVSSGLAPIIVTRLFDAARQAADQGVAVLLVEQQIRRALSIADRVYILSQGTVAFAGSSHELTRRFDVVENAYLAAAPAGHTEKPGVLPTLPQQATSATSATRVEGHGGC
jgi:branched-chain amino acid transport system ATP-binding protein